MGVKCQCLRMLGTSSLCYESWVVRFALWWVFRYFASLNLWKNKRNYYDDQFFYYNKSIFLRDFIFKTKIHFWYSCKLKLIQNSFLYILFKKKVFYINLKRIILLIIFLFEYQIELKLASSSFKSWFLHFYCIYFRLNVFI